MGAGVLEGLKFWQIKKIKTSWNVQTIPPRGKLSPHTDHLSNGSGCHMTYRCTTMWLINEQKLHLFPARGPGLSPKRGYNPSFVIGLHLVGSEMENVMGSFGVMGTKTILRECLIHLYMYIILFMNCIRLWYTSITLILN